MLKSVTLRELVRRLRVLGFEGPYSGGRHFFMIREKLKLRIPNSHLEKVGQESEVLQK